MQIEVEWDMPAGADDGTDFPDGVVLELGYRETGGTWTTRANPPHFPEANRRVSGTTYTSTCTGLTDGTAYEMRLRLCKRTSDGMIGASNCSAWTATLTAPAMTPTAPAADDGARPARPRAPNYDRSVGTPAAGARTCPLRRRRFQSPETRITP